MGVFPYDPVFRSSPGVLMRRRDHHLRIDCRKSDGTSQMRSTDDVGLFPSAVRVLREPSTHTPQHLDRLRQRGLKAKRSLALREFAFGVEALERFVRCEPLRRVHEFVFGVLALESEPVDRRLLRTEPNLVDVNRTPRANVIAWETRNGRK